MSGPRVSQRHGRFSHRLYVESSFSHSPFWDFPLHSLKALKALSPFPGSPAQKEEEISIGVSAFLYFQWVCRCLQGKAQNKNKNKQTPESNKKTHPNLIGAKRKASTKVYTLSKYWLSSKICLLWLVEFFAVVIVVLHFAQFIQRKAGWDVTPSCSKWKFPARELWQASFM